MTRREALAENHIDKEMTQNLLLHDVRRRKGYFFAVFYPDILGLHIN
ncbi:MAG: hypothetical protein H6Q52_2100 [Deltaproteobacteria bacterium]|nr:hypothetical protein [Deltaproteobacteria bacterium]